ncbi:uncharacterized protein LOC114973884 isoform X1 [Acropora millepora]|uniref:uncharacterized protein LOC114973884 isoform X1 n=1 Tax=Acropora millepora TaxID=45264 RepID=UPI001CF4D2E8|nr:uncharacterized protein LOC114973884 isoform X1 [Acropora millepora]
MSTLLRFWIVVIISHLVEETMSQQCPSERSISGWMLQGHVYKTLLADIGLHCLLSCGTDDRCQSFNFVMSSHMCELNDRTKEATPDDFIPDLDRYYFGKRVNRVPLGSIPELAAESCKEIKMSEKEATSGKYWLSSIKPEIPIFAFCNMTTEDIDECTASLPVCHVSAQCNNTLGSYRCICDPGYTYNGNRCTDINECTTLPFTCHMNAECTNTIGSYRCSCNPGYTGNGKTCTAVRASSCNEIFQNQTRTKSQVYTLMLGSRNISVYCFMGDFGCGSGGWTLVMKTDGTKNTFHYSSPFWSNRQAYNLAGGKTGLDKQETKLPSYWETHFSKICLGMRDSSTTRFVVIRQSANSLYALIADNVYRNVSLGRDKWKSLIGPQASLQTGCNKEGFNVVHTSSQSKARIGIIANNENECLTCDSRIGYGTGGLHDDSNTCGNEATISPDNGNKHIKAMGYILVQ